MFVRNYNKKRDYSVILQEIHEGMKLKFKVNNDAQNAKELQEVLFKIKTVAWNLDNENAINDPVPKDIVDLINTAFFIQTNLNVKGHQKLSKHTLFGRRSGTATIAEADNIFEEDLAAVIAAADMLNGNQNSDIRNFLVGTEMTTTEAAKTLSEMPNNLALKTINDMAIAAESRYRAKDLRVAAGKTDVKGFSVNKELIISPKLEGTNVGRLLELMKDATFSAKQYSSKAWSITDKKDFAEIGLRLGQSNLYKAVTGSISELYTGVEDQKSIFYRGAWTFIHDYHNYRGVVELHWSHLRFIYELRGSGLGSVSNQNWSSVAETKYLIYNDNSSPNIFVKDTASLILEALDDSMRGRNLFGIIHISASKVNSGNTINATIT